MKDMDLIPSPSHKIREKDWKINSQIKEMIRTFNCFASDLGWGWGRVDKLVSLRICHYTTRVIRFELKLFEMKDLFWRGPWSIKPRSWRKSGSSDAPSLSLKHPLSFCSDSFHLFPVYLLKAILWNLGMILQTMKVMKLFWVMWFKQWKFLKLEYSTD